MAVRHDGALFRILSFPLSPSSSSCSSRLSSLSSFFTPLSSSLSSFLFPFMLLAPHLSAVSSRVSPLTSLTSQLLASLETRGWKGGRTEVFKHAGMPLAPRLSLVGAWLGLAFTVVYVHCSRISLMPLCSSLMSWHPLSRTRSSARRIVSNMQNDITRTNRRWRRKLATKQMPEPV